MGLIPILIYQFLDEDLLINKLGIFIPSIKVPQSNRKTICEENNDNLERTSLKKNFISMILDQFIRRPIIHELAEENHITGILYYRIFQSFREHCLNVNKIDSALAITFSDIRDQGN